jgi:hypothetical protein
MFTSYLSVSAARCKCFAILVVAMAAVAGACVEPASHTGDMDTSVGMPVADQGADLPVTDLGMDQGVDMAPEQALSLACSGALLRVRRPADAVVVRDC